MHLLLFYYYLILSILVIVYNLFRVAAMTLAFAFGITKVLYYCRDISLKGLDVLLLLKENATVKPEAEGGKLDHYLFLSLDSDLSNTVNINT